MEEEGVEVVEKSPMIDKHMNFATWNLCLGLPNKKGIVIETLKRNNIAVCALQETEISKDFPEMILNSEEFNLELELNTGKKRVGFYIRNDVRYKRRNDLEKENVHVLIIAKSSRSITSADVLVICNHVT